MKPENDKTVVFPIFRLIPSTALFFIIGQPPTTPSTIVEPYDGNAEEVLPCFPQFPRPGHTDSIRRETVAAWFRSNENVWRLRYPFRHGMSILYAYSETMPGRIQHAAYKHPYLILYKNVSCERNRVARERIMRIEREFTGVSGIATGRISNIERTPGCRGLDRRARHFPAILDRCLRLTYVINGVAW